MTNTTFYYYRNHQSEWFNTSVGRSWEGKMTEAEKAASARGAATEPALCVNCNNVRLLPWNNHVERKEAINKFTLNVCPNCGWWKTVRNEQRIYIPGFDSASTFKSDMTSLEENFAILNSFDICDDAAPLDELANILLNDWQYAKYISAQKAEDLVAQIFKNHLDCEVSYFNGAVYDPDHGIDFVLVRADKSTIAFQVKRRQTERAERIQPVREFIGALAESPFQEGFFVTTARLSYYAKKELEKSKGNLEDKGMKLTVVDGARFHDIMELHRPSVKSLVALTKIVPETGWQSQIFDVAELHISEVLERTKHRKT